MKKYFFAVLMTVPVIASASDFEAKKNQVAQWVQELPAVSSLQGDVGCEAIRFQQESDGLTTLKLGEKVKQPWLGMDGDVEINQTMLAQDYSGGGVDGRQYHIRLGLKKSNGSLIEVRYRYYSVTGFIFKKEVLEKNLSCRAN